MQLHFRKLGEGQPLIILHGLLGSSDNWQTLAKSFAGHYTVYLVDQRNHGRSPHHDTFSYDALAADLLKFTEEQQLEKPIVLGHSMGGKTAMKFALTHPGKVAKLIVADIAPKAYRPSSHDDVLEGLSTADIASAKSRADVEQHLAKHIEDSDVRLFLMKNLYRTEDNTFAWRMNLGAIKENMQNIAAEVHSASPYLGPILFIRGAKSRYIKPEDYVLIEHLFPNVEIETIEEAGHWLHAEAPEEFYKLVTNFLNTSDTWQAPST